VRGGGVPRSSQPSDGPDLLSGASASRGGSLQGAPHACDDAGVTGLAGGWTAQLRVYEPLAAFEGEARRRWQVYAADQPRRTAAEALAAEREAGLRALVGRPPAVVPQVGEQAFVLEVDGVTLLCPWQTEVRAWEALSEFVSELPEVVAEAFAPAAVVERAEVDLDRWRLDNEGDRSHVLSSTWHVPLRWFVLVDADERTYALGEPGSLRGGGSLLQPGSVEESGRAPGAPPGRRTGRTLVYRTPMSRARRRVARALAVLRRTVDDGSVTEGVEDLGRWLEEFHPRSLVELDYGGLVHLLDDAELAQDESARDLALALAALNEGDGVRAAAAYARVTARMKALQAVESAN